MSKITAIRQFVESIVRTKIVIARERDDWGMRVDEKLPRLILPSDLQQNTDEDKLYRKFFTDQCKCGKGFSNVTISLLHEIGHWETRDEVDWEAYYDARIGVYDYDYFNLDAELKATNWAIKWLSDPKNRKFAKAFEVKFYGH
jgi:hypothetical protein